MPKRVNEVEFDEFEKLLGEIPCATSVSSIIEEAGVINLSKDLKRVSLADSLSVETSRRICTTPEKSDFSGKLLKPTGSFSEPQLSAAKVQESTIKRVHMEENQSLPSAFEELNFKDRPIMVSTSPSLVNSPSFINHSLLFNGQHPSSMKKYPSGSDTTPIILIPSPKSADHSHTDLNTFDVCPTFENFSGTLPLTHGTAQGFHLLSNLAIPAVEYPMIPNQQQVFFDPQSRLPYLHPQQLSQTHMTWRNVEDEQNYQIQLQQYLYLQQLRNQQLESQRPIRENGGLITRLVNQTTCQACNQESPRRSTNQPTHILDLNSIQVLSQAGTHHKVHEKILTRSHGLNSLTSVKFGSFGGKEPISSLNQVGRVMPHEYFTHNLKGELQLDYLNSRGSYPSVKHNNLRPPIQKYVSVDDFSDRIYFMAKDQNGARFLQKKFTEGTTEELERIFREIIVHIVELMTDPFGNYLVQKLLDVCDESHQMQILHAITRKPGDLVRISCDMHGTRAVQKVIETLKTKEQCSMVVSALKPGIVSLIKNMNGNHVAQRFLQFLTPGCNEFLFEAATANCVELATDQHGCCVLQKCLSHSTDEQRRRLVCEITSNALILCQDPYGNYVVQYVFEIHVPWATDDILDQLEGNYGDLAMQKYSSNVVEKCLKYSGEQRRLCIIDELMNNPRLDQIMQDPYGNYVIQAALNLSKGAMHDALVEAIRPHVPVLRTSPYGKKVLSSNGLKK